LGGGGACLNQVNHFLLPFETLSENPEVPGSFTKNVPTERAAAARP